MRILVIVDSAGDVVATGRMDADADGPAQAALIPGPGQSVHTVDVDDSVLESASVLEIHEIIRGSVPAVPSLSRG